MLKVQAIVYRQVGRSLAVVCAEVCRSWEEKLEEMLPAQFITEWMRWLNLKWEICDLLLGGIGAIFQSVPENSNGGYFRLARSAVMAFRIWGCGI